MLSVFCTDSSIDARYVAQNKNLFLTREQINNMLRLILARVETTRHQKLGPSIFDVCFY